MTMAAFWGTSVGYTDYYNGTVSIETVDGRVAVVNNDTFNYLYFRLSDFVAALKEDCIQYVVNTPDKSIFEYPGWFRDAIANGEIFEDEPGVYVMYGSDGDTEMYPNSMVLRNYKGELMYMDSYKFHQYYDVLEECL